MVAPKAVIFDLYGTLVHLSVPSGDLPLLRLLKDVGLTAEQQKPVFLDLLRRPYPTMQALLTEHYPDIVVDTEFYEQAERELLAQARLFDDVLEVLPRLRTQGYKIGLLTNCSQPYKETFERLAIRHLFDTVVISCDAGYAKPDREVYETILQKLETSPQEAVMVGDMEYDDVIMPCSIGMRAYLIDRGNKPASGSIPSLSTLFDILP